MPSPRAGVARNLVVPIEEANDLVVGDEGERAPSVPARHGVPVGVELHERLSIDGDRRDGVGLRKRIGQREETRALLVEEFDDASFWPSRMRTLVRDRAEELVE